jgi:hypothetical protein
MFDSSSLDKASNLAFSLASDSLGSAVRAVQWLSFLTGVKPEVIVAGGAGLIIFMLMLPLMVLSNRRGRQAPDLWLPQGAVQTAWPSQQSSPHTPSQALRYATISSRSAAAPQRLAKERFALTQELREQLQRRFTEPCFEPNRTDVRRDEHDTSSHRRRAVRVSALKWAGKLFMSSTTQVTALIRYADSPARACLSSFSAAQTQPQCAVGCSWNRVARKGWTDNVRSCLGWYPWQCQQCLRRAYFRLRTW